MRFKRREPRVRPGWRPWRIRSDAGVARAKHYAAFEEINEELFEREEAAQVTVTRAEKKVTANAMTLVRNITKVVRPIMVEVMSADEALRRKLKRGEYVLESSATDEEKKQGFRVTGKVSFKDAAEGLGRMTDHMSQIRKKEILKDVANHASLELTGLRALKVEDLHLYEELSRLEDKCKAILGRKEKKEAQIFELLKGHLAGPAGSPTEAEEILNDTAHTHHSALKGAITTIAKEIAKEFAKEKEWDDYLRKLRLAVKALIAELNEAIAFAKRELRAIRSQSHIDRVARQLGYKTREIASMETKLLESIMAAIADLEHFEDTQLILMDQQAKLIKKLHDETKLDAVRAVPIHPRSP